MGVVAGGLLIGLTLGHDELLGWRGYVGVELQRFVV